MATCTVTYTLQTLAGANDATNFYTLKYRQSGTGQVTSGGALYPASWETADIGGSAAARTITLEQAEYYDFQFPQGRRVWNNCLCPSESTADLQDLLATAS